MKVKDYVFASTASEARSLCKKFGDAAYYVAGGTSTRFVDSKNAKVAIDISRIPFRGISTEGGTFRIGAGTTIDDIMKYKEQGWVLNRVASAFANQHVRNVSTIGGNISRIFYWSDFPVALRVLEGTIGFFDETSRSVKISDAFLNRAAHRDTFNEALLEYIEIPALDKGEGFGYAKDTRTHAAFGTATAAAYVKIAEGMSLEYCRHLLEVNVADAILEAMDEAAGGSHE
ncbi:MAG: FAD binding domain-containing protein [bacterium]